MRLFYSHGRAFSRERSLVAAFLGFGSGKALYLEISWCLQVRPKLPLMTHVSNLAVEMKLSRWPGRVVPG
jgi:hypothetical protein